MKRWLWVAAALALTGGAVWFATGSERQEASSDTRDQLAFDLDPDQSVDLSIPPGTTLVHVGSSLVLDAALASDPLARFPYRLQVELLDAADALVWSHTYWLEGRVSSDSEDPLAFAVRLEDGQARATDPRTIDVPVGGLTTEPRRLRVTARCEDGQRVLVRGTRTLRRPEIDASVFGRRLDEARRDRIAEGRASLGFFDLPDRARDAALTRYEEQLSAAGVGRSNLKLTRIWTSRWRSRDVLTRPNHPVLANDWSRVALNFIGDQTLDVVAPPGRTLEVRQAAFADQPLPYLDRGSDPPRLVTSAEPDRVLRYDVPAHGVVSIPLSSPTARTVSVGFVGPELSPVSFYLRERTKGGQITDEPAFVGANGFLAIRPDTRFATTYRVDESEPLSTTVVTGQPALRISLRRSFAADPDVATTVPVKVLITRSGRAPAMVEHIVQPTFLRSRFDHLDVGDGAAVAVSDPFHVYVRFPDEEPPCEVAVVGGGGLWATFSVPGADEAAARLAPAYEVPLPPNARWRFAQLEAARWEVIAPDEDTVGLDARRGRVVGQARISFAPEIDRGPVAERVVPLAGGVERRVSSSAFVPKGGALPSGARSAVEDATMVEIASDGATARGVVATFEVGEDALGGTARLLVDGKERARAPIMTLSGTLRADVEAGPHRIEVVGLGEVGRAFVDAPPAGGGAVTRTRSVFIASPGTPMTLTFRVEAGKRLYVVLFVVSNVVEDAFDVRWSLGGGATPVHFAPLLHYTELSGRLRGTTEAPSRSGIDALGGNGVARAVIPVGGDLQSGLVTLTLTSTGPRPIGIRAVVAGETPSGDPTFGEPLPHLWTEDVE